MPKRYKLLILVLAGIFLAIIYSYSEASSKTYGYHSWYIAKELRK